MQVLLEMLAELVFGLICELLPEFFGGLLDLRSHSLLAEPLGLLRVQNGPTPS
jgi:hypothetical protein